MGPRRMGRHVTSLTETTVGVGRTERTKTESQSDDRGTDHSESERTTEVSANSHL